MGMEATTKTSQSSVAAMTSRRRRPQAQDKAWHSALRHAHISLNASDRLVMVYGHPAVTQLTLQAAAERAVSGQPVVYLDAAHTFDSLLIGRCAKARRQPPRKVLALIHVARAFSWQQMERLVSCCLAGALDRYEARTAVISGLFETLAEEQASDREGARMSDRLLEAVQELTRKGYSLLCPCPSIPLPAAQGRRLFVGLRAVADRLIHVHEEPGPRQGHVLMEEETSMADGVPLPVLNAPE
jgi:hypothetical protein